MITTSQIAPSPALAPFVHSYTYREFDTNGIDLFKPWHASHQSGIIFFLKALPIKLIDSITGKTLKTGKNCDVVGMSTKCNGEMLFNGSYAFFQIIFKPNGFHKIFNKPPIELANKILWSEDIFNADIKVLHEQFCEASNTSVMVDLADSWLLSYLNKNKRVDYKDRITIVANLITKTSGLLNVDKLANFACMSPRNFERVFLQETGMSPKQLCCIARFNHAIELKQKFPLLKWTSIAQDSGYFDQNHLIKDFKRYCGSAPLFLFNSSPLFNERYLNPQ